MLTLGKQGSYPDIGSMHYPSSCRVGSRSGAKSPKVKLRKRKTAKTNSSTKPGCVPKDEGQRLTVYSICHFECIPLNLLGPPLARNRRGLLCTTRRLSSKTPACVTTARSPHTTYGTSAGNKKMRHLFSLSYERKFTIIYSKCRCDPS